MTPRPDNWFDIRETAAGVFLIREPGHVNSFLVAGRQKAALIDSGMGFCRIRPVVDGLVKTPVMVLNTHWHFDHIGGNQEFDRIGISEPEAHRVVRPLASEVLTALYLRDCFDAGLPMPEGFVPEHHTVRSPAPDFFIRDRDRFDLGGRVLEAIATPGHTRGSMSFWDTGTRSLFCGDLVYDGTLYAHFEDSNLDDYIKSLEKITGMGDRVRRFFVSHNEPELMPSFAAAALAAVKAVKTGGAPGRVVYDWGVPAMRFEYGGAAVLGKVPGTKGVCLIPGDLNPPGSLPGHPSSRSAF